MRSKNLLTLASLQLQSVCRGSLVLMFMVCDPSIQQLAVHDHNQQFVTFKENNVEQALQNVKRTTLLGWFQLNRTMPRARQFKYHEIPEHFVWNAKTCQWTECKRGRSIGRMYTTNPAQGERHYLRMLLHHVPGAMSFDDLRTLPDGRHCESFKEMVIRLGLLATDNEWDECLAEASSSFLPFQIRSLFVTILVFGEPLKPLDLWIKYKKAMGEDILRKCSQTKFMDTTRQQDHVDNSILFLLQTDLHEFGTCLENFGLPAPEKSAIVHGQTHVVNDEIFDELEQERKTRHNLHTFNQEQTSAYQIILKAVLDSEESKRLFFINAPGGYGKTFLLETVLSTVRSVSKIALAVASTGIAAELLEGGRTAYSCFKIPIPILDESMCSISLQSAHAQLMRQTSLICWDEVLMSNKQHIECVDRSLRDILKVDRPFGGIPVVFGGDPRQILPVIPHGDRPRIVQACVKSSHLWKNVHQIDLKENMRVHPEEVEFSNYLLMIGEGTAQIFPDVGDDMIKVPQKFLVRSLPELIMRVFPHIQDGYRNKYDIAHRAILTPKNENVDKINAHVMSLFPGKSFVYKSADTIAEEEIAQTYPTEFLNSLTLSGLLPHEMELKIGSPVMLLRNLRAGARNGLRNGTRMIVVHLGEQIIEAEIASGVNKGKCVLIPRITLIPSDTQFPFTLKRRQFPIRSCFAMTMNKAQGQTLEFVGIYLPEDVFSHGQLYVALSRVQNSSSLAILTNNMDGYTKKHCLPRGSSSRWYCYCRDKLHLQVDCI